MSLASIRQAAAPMSGNRVRAAQGRRTPVRSVAWLVLPLSLLPPVLLANAAAGHPLLYTAADAPWRQIAAAFFLAQIAAFAAMGPLIRRISARYKIDVSLRDAYALAAVCPVPMWLSSLALLVDNLAVSVAIGLAGLWLSEVLAFRGSRALARGNAEVLATGFAASVVGAGLVAWALLMMLVAVLA